MIINPRKELIVPAHVGLRMKGFFRLKCIRPDGRVRVDTGWMPNTILNNGRNNMATELSWLTDCRVGTDSTVPSQTDTQLLGQVAATATIDVTTDGAQASAPYYGWKRKTFRFPVGAGQGGQNLSEAGVGWASTGTTLISRALIVDPDTQLPTTVTPLSDEILDVTYEMRYYPPLVDVTNSITLDGVNYDTTVRAAQVTGSRWSDDIGNEISFLTNSTTWFRAYDGVLGTLEQFPSGNSANLDSTGGIQNLSYSNNSYERGVTVSAGVNGWNLAAGIRSMSINTTAGAYQMQLDSNPGANTVPKNTNYLLTLGWTIGWTEKV